MVVEDERLITKSQNASKNERNFVVDFVIYLSEFSLSVRELCFNICATLKIECIQKRHQLSSTVKPNT